jgi:hypothetical protein
MTILVEKCLECMKTNYGAGAPGETGYHPDRLIARDVMCPDGHHLLSQQWKVAELRHLLDTGSPVFHCDAHAYKWNPDAQELEVLRALVNAFDGGGLPDTSAPYGADAR